MIPGCSHTDAAICQADTCRWPACVPGIERTVETYARCETCGHRERVYTVSELWNWPEHCGGRMKVGADR